LSNGTARVRTERCYGFIRRDGRRRPPDGSAGDARRVPRIEVVKKTRSLGSSCHGDSSCSVGEGDGTGRFQSFDHGCVIGRDKFSQDPGTRSSTGGLDPQENIFYGHGTPRSGLLRMRGATSKTVSAASPAEGVAGVEAEKKL